MALNPPISQNGLPLRVEGEFMVLERKNIECEFKIDGMDKKKTGKGKVIKFIPYYYIIYVDFYSFFSYISQLADLSLFTMIS
jgi:hypothetical protein